MSYDLAKLNSKVMSIEEIRYVLSKVTIFDKIVFSGITKEAIKTKLDYLRTKQVPQRSVLLSLSGEEVIFFWFKNWLHPSLKHWVDLSPRDKKGVSKKLLQKDLARDTLRFYENGQHNFKYSLQEIEEWAESNE